MSHRTQVVLGDEQYELLKQESARTGLGLGELVRRAVDRAYGRGSLEDRRRLLEESRGAWAERDLDGEQYVEQLRQGLGRRLAEIDR